MTDKEFDLIEHNVLEYKRTGNKDLVRKFYTKIFPPYLDITEPHYGALRELYEIYLETAKEPETDFDVDVCEKERMKQAKSIRKGKIWDVDWKSSIMAKRKLIDISNEWKAICLLMKDPTKELELDWDDMEVHNLAVRSIINYTCNCNNKTLYRKLCELKATIKEVLQIIEDNGWVIESNKYKNLTTKTGYVVEGGERVHFNAVYNIADMLDDWVSWITLLEEEFADNPTDAQESNTAQDEVKKRGGNSFKGLIQYEDKAKLLKRLHSLIDGNKGKRVGLVLNRAYYDKLISAIPTQEEFKSEFKLIGSWQAIHKYTSNHENDIADIVIFE